jgi:hypothetical protein
MHPSADVLASPPPQPFSASRPPASCSRSFSTVPIPFFFTAMHPIAQPPPRPRSALGLLRRAFLLPALALGLLASATHAAEPGQSQQLQSLDETPKGLAKSDWQSIRAAYDAGQHAFQPLKGQDSQWQARNPGQQWTTKFDPSGFLITPKGGGWSWGLELERGADASVSTAVHTAGKDGRPVLSYPGSAAVTEWFINDKRGLEQGWTLSAPAEVRLRVRGSLKPAVSPLSARRASASAASSPTPGSRLGTLPARPCPPTLKPQSRASPFAMMTAPLSIPSPSTPSPSRPT